MNINIKYYYKKAACLLFLLMLTATACTDNPIAVEPGYEGDEEVSVVLNIKGLFNEENAPPTYGLTPGTPPTQPGTGSENLVNNITVFIFNAITNACDKIIQGNSYPLDTVLVKSGNKKIVAVANADLYFSSFYGPGDESLIGYNGLRRMLTDPALTVLPSPPFLMTGEATAQLQPEKPVTTPNEVNIEVKRAVAKVKIFVTKDFPTASSFNLTLEKITLYKGANKVSVLQNDPFETGIAYNLSAARMSFTVSGASSNVIPLKSTNTFCQLADTFYVFESLAARDTSKAVYFEFEVGVNTSTNIRTCRVYLAEGNLTLPTDTLYDVYRNNWYNVYVNIIDPGMDSVNVKVVACPWNVAPPQDTIMGEGFEAKPSSPFKLVKYYDQADKQKDSTILAINKHSKGASYIDLKVTPGTLWELNWASGAAVGNEKAIFSADTGKTWVEYPALLSGSGDNNWQRIYIYRPYREANEPKTGPSVTLKVGGKNVRTFVVEPRDSLKFPTNSYVMRPQGFNQGTGRSETFIPLKYVYDFWEDFILSNGDTIPAGTQSIDVSWQDNTGTVVIAPPASIINANDRKNSYIRAEAGDVQGNAVIDFKINGKIYWSFHIWNTEYSPYEPAGQILYRPTGHKNIFMDRNLGAMDTLYTSTGSAKGLYYQFGRKDPFRGGVNWTTTFQVPLATAAEPAGAHTDSVRPLKAIPEILQHPQTFYSPDFSHHFDEDNELWNRTSDNKTAFDPCPEGYRVPIQRDRPAPSYSPWYNAAFVVGSANFLNGFYNNVLRYYPGSYIGNNGLLNNTNAYYWTSYASNSNTAGMFLSTTGTVTNLSYDINKATGAYVRCVIDKKYIENKGTIFGRYTSDIQNSLK